MKQTAVEFLAEALRFTSKEVYAELYEVLLKAENIFQEQIENAYWDGGQDIPTSIKTCKWYYNETFKTNEK
jgi:hypothetical protein